MLRPRPEAKSGSAIVASGADGGNRRHFAAPPWIEGSAATCGLFRPDWLPIVREWLRTGAKREKRRRTKCDHGHYGS